MSYIDARDQLRAAGRELGYTDDDEWADTLLARHAHELAERIRAELPDPNPLGSIFRPYVGTLAADLIDPEAKPHE